MKISVVITTHGECINLPLMLMCLDLQRECVTGVHSRDGHMVEWSMGKLSTLPIERIIVSDGDLGLENEAWAYTVDTHPNYKSLTVPREGGVGHNTRGVGIEAATGDFIVLTNEDNYFVQGWRHRLESNIKLDTGMIYHDVVNNLWKYTNYGGSKLERGRIDLSCAVIRTDIAKKIGYSWRHYDSDFDFIKACEKESKLRKLKITYLPEILVVHN